MDTKNYSEEIFEKQKNNSKDKNGNIDTENLDARLALARDYMNIAIKNMIDYSPDGKILTKKSKEEAKAKTLKMFK